MKTLKLLAISAMLIAALFTFNNRAYAHCEIPCGIYGDSLRISLMYEHIKTIEKSMSQIQELSKAAVIDYNQLTRWVINKEEHATQLQDIVSQYFLHQRLKPTDISNTEAYNKYIQQLTLLHQLLVYAMKSKQTTDLAIIDKMRDTVHSFEHAYFE
ncbi:MAG: superoxide dismutase [Bacteroidota bacterium]|nr:MAG: superoxide dismutase [Bacteroidota bacterium]